MTPSARCSRIMGSPRTTYRTVVWEVGMRITHLLLGLILASLTACGGSGVDFFPDGTSPQQFYFGTVTSSPGAIATSDDVTPTGYIYPATISIENGQYSLDSGTTWSSSTGTISPGGKIRVRNTAPSTTQLHIGGTSVTFTSIASSAPIATVSVSPKSTGANPGTLITLNGSNSQGAAPLTFAWISPLTCTALPTLPGITPSVSSVTLSSATVAAPTFTPDAPGICNTTLTVSNSVGTSTPFPVTVTINDLAHGTPPSGTGIISVYRADANAPSSTSPNVTFNITFTINNTGAASVSSVTMGAFSNTGKTTSTPPKFCGDSACTAASQTSSRSVTISAVTTGNNTYSAGPFVMTLSDFNNIDPNGWQVANSALTVTP